MNQRKIIKEEIDVFKITELKKLIEEYNDFDDNNFYFYIENLISYIKYDRETYEGKFIFEELNVNLFYLYLYLYNGNNFIVNKYNNVLFYIFKEFTIIFNRINKVCIKINILDDEIEKNYYGQHYIYDLIKGNKWLKTIKNPNYDKIYSYNEITYKSEFNLLNRCLFIKRINNRIYYNNKKNNKNYNNYNLDFIYNLKLLI